MLSPDRKRGGVKAKSRPRWANRELTWRDKPAKSYGRQAPGQMRVLDLFQGRRWPARLDVTALVPPGAYAKRWIADTVKNLNRGLKRIRFHADGGNHTIGWRAA